MNRIIYKIFTWIQHQRLKKKGYCLGKNVIISNKGVRKIGKGKIFCSDNVNHCCPLKIAKRSLK